ncbi:MAG TPA: selenium-dependent molybdenum hydroxylase 1, partial [Candidatus Acetothermia bacterium]|nr:selenium-dependent molybdenum hydroxylase 1 [Candidatus Acetothermia bacterium]
MEEKLKRGGLIGSSIDRPDAIDKVRGEARYVDDLALPGMLYGAVIRSEHPHARIKGVDLSAVEEDPDVVCTVTARDVPGENVVHV